MTPECAYELARYARPGVKIVMGATEAREEQIRPLDVSQLSKLPGDSTWFAYLIRQRLGFVPSEWAKIFACQASALGHDVTDNEWHWLHGPATLTQARAWISELEELNT